MENDPMITQRMRDIARTAICKEISEKFVQCSNEAVRAFKEILNDLMFLI
jgi:hypothetical protein